MEIHIRMATLDDVEIVTNMVADLLSELSGNHVSRKELTEVCTELLSQKRSNYTAFLAFTEDSSVGLITLSEIASMYARGLSGVIQEFYVLPTARSLGIGDRLIRTAIQYGNQCSWTRLEVGAPNAEKWHRTVSFYQRVGFKEIGPRFKYVFDTNH